jgi:glycerol-3-phosphate dehydrogenase
MHYDIAIVGGGITGAGIARDAALRGLRVALFEKEDYAAGTSSKSSKLIHGGLRYLEHGEVGLVFESVSERAVQRKVAPHLVRPLPFLVPIYSGLKPGLETMNIGLWIYDTLALFRSPKMHRTVRGPKASKLEDGLNHEGLRGAIEYYDCITDDARLVLENVLDAAEVGADCHAYTRVIGFLYRDDGKVAGLRVRDELTGEEREMQARLVVVAAGAWTDEFARAAGLDFGRTLLRRTKGVHIVFPREKQPLRRAITLLSPIDGRVMFAIPWKHRTVLGTTDTDFEGTADDCHADADDVRYLCDGGNRIFPKANFRPDDVIATWSGLRPLINSDADDPGAVSREHEIFVRDEGIIVIAGGKLTTYRLMAKQVVKQAIGWLEDHYEDEIDNRRLRKAGTKKRPLPGAAGLAKKSMTGVLEIAHGLCERHGLDDEVAQHLAYTYGVRAELVGKAIDGDARLAERMQGDLPHVWAEVDFSVQHDLAKTVRDILDRRISLILTGRDQGLDVVDRVAARAGALLGWDDARIAAEIAAYRTDVANSRRFR